MKSAQSPKWKSGSAPNEILQKVRTRLRLGSNGEVQALGFEFDKFATFLKLAIKFDESIHSIDAFSIVQGALAEATRENTLSAEGLLGKLQKEQNRFLAKPLRKMTVVTQVTIKYGKHLTLRKIRNSSIHFCATLPKKIDRQKEVEKAERRGVPKSAPENTFALISVRARSNAEAMSRAIQSMEILTGFWNLTINYRKENLFRDDFFAPLNTIFAGPIYTLHDVNGNSIDQDTWYEDSFPRNAINIVDIENIWPQLVLLEKNVKATLAKRDEASDFLHFIREYSVALNYSDMPRAFISLWRCLERFTFTKQNENHDATVRRASSLFQDHDYYREVIDQVRHVRNDIVHYGKDEPFIRMLVEELRMVVESVMQFNFFNSFGLKKSDEFRRFLMLSTSVDDLEAQIEERKEEIAIRRKAIKYRQN